NASLKFEKRNLSPLVARVEALAYYSYIDHVMDNFSLRASKGMKMLNNPDRETKGARVAVTLTPSDPLQLVLGADIKSDQHTVRNGVNYRSVARKDDFGFDRYGVFGEATYALDDARRLIGGLRVDDHEVTNDNM